MQKPTVEVKTAAILLALTALALLIMIFFNVWNMDPRQQTIDPALIPSGPIDMEQIMQTAFISMLVMQGVVLAASLLAAVGLFKVKKWGWWIGLILAIVHLFSFVNLFSVTASTLTPLPFLHIGVGLAVFILLMLRDTRVLFFEQRR